MRFPMVQPVTEMTRAALGARLAPGADGYLDMFHDDAVFEFPFGISGPVHIEDKPAMAAYLARIEGATIFDRFDLKAAYPCGLWAPSPRLAGMVPLALPQMRSVEQRT